MCSGSAAGLRSEHPSSPEIQKRYEGSRAATPSGTLDDCGRASTPLTPLVLNKALLPIRGPPEPDEDDDDDLIPSHKDDHNDHNKENAKQGSRPGSDETDVSVPEFEGYLDILSYLQRDLPEKPASSTYRARLSRGSATPSPPMVQVTLKMPKEEEWMSCRSPSQSSLSGRSHVSKRSATAVGGSGNGGVGGGGASALSRTNSNTTKTVTPMSSVDSESELRLLYPKQSVPTLAESRIEEEEGDAGIGSGSEPLLPPHLQKTPQKNIITNIDTVPSKCFHCGRDPSGPDPAYTNSSFVTILKTFDGEKEPEVHVERKGGDMREAARGPSIPVEDAKGQRYLLYPQTAFFEVVGEETGDDSYKASEAKTDVDITDQDESGVFGKMDYNNGDDFGEEAEEKEGGVLEREDEKHHPHAAFGMTPLESTRRDIAAYALGEDEDEHDDEEEASDESQHYDEAEFWDCREQFSSPCTPIKARHPPLILPGTAKTAPRAVDPYERPFSPDPYSSLDSPSFEELLHHSTAADQHQEEDPDETEEDDDDATPTPAAPPTFWKDPDGVIVVYKGVEVNGKQFFYGADINYLGSFYDDEADSSGLGSSHGGGHSPSDSVGTVTTLGGGSGGGLCVIPESPFSDGGWEDDEGWGEEEDGGFI